MKNFLSMFSFFYSSAKEYRWRLLLYLFISAAFWSLSLVQPYLFGSFVDGLSKDTGINVLSISSAFLLVALLRICLSYYSKITGTSLSVQISTHIKAQLFRHFQKTSPRFHQSEDAATLANKINNDTEYLVMFFLNLGMQAPGNLLLLLLASSYVFYVDIQYGSVLLCTCFLLWVLYRFFGHRILKASQKSAGARSAFFGSLDEQLRSVRSVRLHSSFCVLSQRFCTAGDAMKSACVSEEKVAFPCSMISENMDVFMQVFLFLYGGFCVLNKQISIGQFTTLYFYLSIITSSLSYFLNLGKEIQRHLAYYQRLKELADVPEEGNGSELPTPLENITAEGLNFSYTEGEPVLENLSQTFERDKIYCLAGRNGSGKSTLSDILLGLYVSDGDPSVKYNGVPLQEIDLYEMRASHTGVSEQEPMMLNGSVGFNITYREDGERDEGRLRELLEMVDFRKGEVDARDLDALLALNANELSGGQKQKVSIVKALYKDPELLVLDEPTSALDAESRKRLAEYLKNHAKGRITILVSHDQELLDIADQVVRLGKEQA